MYCKRLQPLSICKQNYRNKIQKYEIQCCIIFFSNNYQRVKLKPKIIQTFFLNRVTLTIKYTYMVFCIIRN